MRRSTRLIWVGVAVLVISFIIEMFAVMTTLPSGSGVQWPLSVRVFSDFLARISGYLGASLLAVGVGVAALDRR